jgi:hypothetical protein
MRPAYAHKTACITLKYYYYFMPPGRLKCARRADHGDILVGSINIMFIDFKSKHRREPRPRIVPDGICAPGLSRSPQFAWAEWLTARVPAGNRGQIVLGARNSVSRSKELQVIFYGLVYKIGAIIREQLLRRPINYRNIIINGLRDSLFFSV